MSDIDSLLDANLDDLADLPAFAVYPPGTHKAILAWSTKDVNGKGALELKLKAVETVELANPAADKPLEAGAESSVLFMLDNEFGQGKLKQIMGQLAGIFGGGSVREVKENSQGMEVTVVTKQRKDKTDPDKVYLDLVKVIG